MKARRVGHFRNNRRRQETDGVEGKGEINRTSRYEADRHGFTDGAAGAEYDGSNNAGFRRREHDLEDGLNLCGAKGQGGASQLSGNRAESGFTDVDDCGENHQGQNQDGGDQISASRELVGRGALENLKFQLIHERIQDQNSQKAIDDGGDSGQQFHRRTNDSRQPWRRHFGEENGRHNTDGNSD